MGVINNQRRTRTFTSDSTDSNQLQDLLEELNIRHTRTRGGSRTTSPASLDRHTTRRKLKKPVGFPKPEPTFRGLGCRGKSHRKLRRYENGNLLHQSLAFLGVDGSDMDDFDLVPQRLSVFARLLMEEESLMMWYDFISKSEEEQELFLSCSRKKTKQR